MAFAALPPDLLVALPSCEAPHKPHEAEDFEERGGQVRLGATFSILGGPGVTPEEADEVESVGETEPLSLLRKSLTPQGVFDRHARLLAPRARDGLEGRDLRRFPGGHRGGAHVEAAARGEEAEARQEAPVRDGVDVHEVSRAGGDVGIRGGQKRPVPSEEGLEIGSLPEERRFSGRVPPPDVLLHILLPFLDPGGHLAHRVGQRHLAARQIGAGRVTEGGEEPGVPALGGGPSRPQRLLEGGAEEVVCR
jgi:hypothetical protein